MADSKSQLKLAYDLHKQGKSAEAVPIVQNVLRQERENVHAWWLLANIVDNEDRQRKCLERVLVLNPAHAGASKMLKQLDGEAEETASLYDLATALPEKTKRTAKSERKRKDARHKQQDRIVMFAVFFMLVMMGAAVAITAINSANSTTATVEVADTQNPVNADYQRAVQEGWPVNMMPETTLIYYFQSLFRGNADAVEFFTCSASRNSYSYRQLIRDVRELGEDADVVQIDVSGAHGELIERRDDTVFVRAWGNLIINYDNFMTTDIDFTQLTYQTQGGGYFLEYENGFWRVCP